MAIILLVNTLKSNRVEMCKKYRCLPVFCSIFLIAISANANECISYKTTPQIIINTPDYTMDVIRSNTHKNLLHGNVVATMIDNYDIVADVVSVDGGFCVVLKSVDAIIGYNDFLVKIDMRHEPDSCSYNAILSHEMEHIGTYLSVINDYKSELHSSLFSAANSIMPIFITDKNDADNAINMLNQKLQSHPDVILTLQKIHADEEIKNKNIDATEDYSELKKCL